MDFLLRDSLHAGVAYGRFDHHRLIDSLRILPEPRVDEADEERPPTLGLEEGGIYTAEALLLARYFMYQQVYFHHVRRAYDIHLIDFLRAWLPEGYPIDPSQHPVDLSRHLAMNDNVVLAAMEDAAFDSQAVGHDPARRFITRDHFRLLYSRRPQDVAINPNAGPQSLKACGSISRSKATFSGTTLHRRRLRSPLIFPSSCMTEASFPLRCDPLSCSHRRQPPMITFLPTVA
jgi:hypothetical protein